MARGSRATAVAKVGTALEPLLNAQLCDTYTNRDYEVILDVLYGLFSQEAALRVRVFDPFIADAQRAPLVTPRMLAERIEALLGANANA